MKTTQDGGKDFSIKHRPSFHQEMLLVLISIRGWDELSAVVSSEGFYANEKLQWHQLGSNKRPADL